MEDVILLDWCTHEYSKFWKGQTHRTNGSLANAISIFWKVAFFLTHPVQDMAYNCDSPNFKDTISINDVSEMQFDGDIKSTASEGQLLQVNVNDQ